MIKVENLTKDYSTLRALKGINFEVQPGQIVGLLGPNGAGKTTIMKIITGFLLPTSGQVTVGDIDVLKNPSKIQQMIGYLPESTPLYPELSVYESLEFSAEAHGLVGEKLEAALNKVVKLCGLKEKLHYDISELSKGYKQRVGLAQALIHDPDILILDEPTTGLDPNQILDIRKLIISLGQSKTIILSTHIMQEVEAVCSRVIMIKQGEIVADDSVKELKHEQLTGYSTKVVVKGPQDKIKIIFEQISGILNVQTKTMSDSDTTTFIIASEDDIRAQLNKDIITAGYDILEISSSEKSMEDIFHKLTK
jgi:ABC-2 type transport system ATP-binding protein